MGSSAGKTLVVSGAVFIHQHLRHSMACLYREKGEKWMGKKRGLTKFMNRLSPNLRQKSSRDGCSLALRPILGRYCVARFGYCGVSAGALYPSCHSRHGAGIGLADTRVMRASILLLLSAPPDEPERQRARNENDAEDDADDGAGPARELGAPFLVDAADLWVGIPRLYRPGVFRCEDGGERVICPG